MKIPFYQFILFWAGAFVCLYLAFSPTVNMPYTNHDSIRYFHKFYNHESASQTNPLYKYLKDEGRPVAAEFEELLYKHINHLSDMSRLRLITIAVIALCAALLIMIVRSAGMEILPAFCLSVAMCTLPGVQDIIFVPYLFVALALLFSLLANFILTKKLIFGINFILAIVLLEAVFFMYPPATFIFLVPTMFLVIFYDDWQVLKRILFRDVLLWAVAAVIYYCISKLFFYAQIRSTGHEITFTWKTIFLSIMTFLSQGVPQVFNLWNVYYSKALGFFMIGLIAVFIAIDSFTARKIGWKKLLALGLLFLIFNVIWFLFGGYMPRQFIAAQALALALVYWCVEWLGNIGKRGNEIFARVWPVSFLCFGLIVANQMTTSNVLNNYSELMFIRSRLVQFVNSSTKEIHFIRLKDDNRGYNGLPRVYDNINGSTPDYEIPDLVRVALKDMGDPFELHCMITYSYYGVPFTLMPNSVVIDLNDLREMIH